MSRAPLALKIAWRYLTAPKSHGAVNAISIISVVGVAIATAAIVIVLSVFNGFRYHLNERLDSLTTDVTVMPVYGKTIEFGDSLAKVLDSLPGVEIAMAEVSDNALVIGASKEMPITVKGVSPAIFSQISSIHSLLIDGEPIENYSQKESSISVGVAQRLGLYSSGDTLLIFAPKRHGRVNMANPAASFISDSIRVSSVFRSMENEYDENTVICDINTARNLFQYDNEATAIHLKAERGISPVQLASRLRETLGENFIVKDRIQQQEINFRMVSIEKWITFILLVFILLIASFNIISTLCMLVIDKNSALHTFYHLGLSRQRIGTIFRWESLLVTLAGGIAGLIIGVALSLLQEKLNIIKLAGDPESLVMTAYPVKVEWLDLGVTMIPILIIGIICAWISDYFAKGKLKSLK